MFASKENTKPSHAPLVIWFIQVITVLVFCCIVISLCFIPWPPTYVLVNSAHLDHESAIQDNAKMNRNTTVMFLLVITNPNKGKDIIHGDTTVTLYKDGSVLGVETIPGFYQGQTSNYSTRVLVNADQLKLRQEDINRNSTLEFGLESWVRYRILGWTSKRYLLKLEASVPVSSVNGTSAMGEGLKFQPVKKKL